jgi:energy-coupled thiamine transporter ThiT
MVPILLIGLLYGPEIGFVTGLLFGVIDFILAPYIMHPVQVLFDYPLAFTALGVVGYFKDKGKVLTIVGVILAILARFLAHFISGIVFYASSAPAGTSPAAYSFVYNMSYLAPEGILCILVLKNFFTQNKLRYMANYDELTGLFNRRYFKQFFNNELLRIKRYSGEGCLALIDLDNFKSVNDTYGHNVGDKALKLFADILRENVRKSDIYARMSGDEFVILFINCSKKIAIERLEQIRNVLTETTNKEFSLGFSYGVCEINSHSELSCDDIFGIADKEMYCDKNCKEHRL